VSADRIRIVATGFLFLFVLLSGVWLSRSGKPYNAIILTIHKLISLAAGALFAIAVYQTNQVATLSAPELTAALVTGLVFLATVITGGLLSTDKSMPAAILTAHQITPFLTAISAAVTLYLLQSR
jgi:hypothetical protein